MPKTFSQLPQLQQRLLAGGLSAIGYLEHCHGRSQDLLALQLVLGRLARLRRLSRFEEGEELLDHVLEVWAEADHGS